LAKRAQDDADSFARLRDQGWGSKYAGPNEPPIWRGRDYRRRLMDYYAHWKPAMHKHGLRTGDLNFSVSWPLCNHIDTEDWWPDFEPLWALQIDGDTTNLHEYVSSAGYGDLGNVPWRAEKHKLCPTPHKNIVIAETGLDQAVLPGQPHSGWMHHWTPERYLLELQLYHSNLDHRVIGTCLFLLDYHNREWITFTVDTLVERTYFRADNWTDLPRHLSVPKHLALPCDPSCRLTQGWKERPDYYRQFGNAGHNGLDLAPTVDVFNSPIRAAAPGRVFRIREGGGYGRHLYINHGWGVTLYAHAERILVRDQQDVAAGEPIAIMGSTGNSTGIHIHFGLLVFGRYDKSMNDWQDPSPFLAHALGGETKPQPSPSPADPQRATARSLRWNAEESAREIQRALADLQTTNRRLLDNVIPAAYTLEEG
ncbi:MAG: M23 family metallopeptidase, partial [Lentisphaerae bacterium]|nr:M23 family metallopeptidase [Lentisphaerota bacterium]